jgi:hypothetical protein
MGEQIFAFEVQPNVQTIQLCARVEGSVSGGGVLTVSTAGAPGVSPVLTVSNDTAPCTVAVAQLTQPVAVTLSRSPTGVNPATLCVTAAGFGPEALTAGTTGGPIPPAINWAQDP